MKKFIEYGNPEQDSSLFFGIDEYGATLEIKYKNKNYIIDLIVRNPADIRDEDGVPFSAEELRERFNTTKELYEAINNGDVEEIYDTWFTVYVNGKHTEETIYRISEFKEWTDEDIYNFLDEFEKNQNN